VRAARGDPRARRARLPWPARHRAPGTSTPATRLPRADRAPATDCRRLAAGALAGLILGTISSAAILADRIARGDSWVVMTTDAVVAASAVVVLAITFRWSFESFRPDAGASAQAPGRLLGAISAHAAGAVLGVLLVHLALHSSPLRACQWLCERPPQLVNDFVAAFGAIALIWTCARQPVGALSSLLVVGIAVIYSFTSSRWHLDAWGDALLRGSQRSISVQTAVLVQLAATAVGVSVFFRLSVTKEGSLDAR
jgi:hypothetical protein